MKNGIYVSILVLLFFFQNCTNSIMATDMQPVEINKTTQSSTAAVIDQPSTSPTINGETATIPIDPNMPLPLKPKFLYIHYFHGGWYGMAPNWATDLKIYLNRDGTLQIASQHRDSECYKVGRTLTKAEAAEVKEMMSSLHLVFHPLDESQPIMLDGGVNQIRVGRLDGSVQVIELEENPGLVNYYSATNGKKVETILKDLDNTLAVVCQ